MKEGHGTILDSKDIDKDCTCRLWTKNSLFGKAEFDIKASKKENRAMSDAAVSGCIVKKKNSFNVGSHALNFWFCFILSN